MLNKLVEQHEINSTICRPEKKSWRTKLQHAGG